MGLKLNQTLVGHSHKFCTTIATLYLIGRTDCRSRVLWLSLCPGFSLCNMQCTFPHQRGLNVGLKTPCMHQLNISELYECCHWQWGPTVIFPRAIICSSISLGYTRISTVPPLGRQFNLMQAPLPQEALPGYNRWPVQIPTFPFLGLFTRFTYRMQNSSTALGFYTSKCPQFQLSPLKSFPSSHLPLLTPPLSIPIPC